VSGKHSDKAGPLLEERHCQRSLPLTVVLYDHGTEASTPEEIETNAHKENLEVSFFKQSNTSSDPVGNNGRNQPASQASQPPASALKIPNYHSSSSNSQSRSMALEGPGPSNHICAQCHRSFTRMGELR
jgi:hypothetical protein